MEETGESDHPQQPQEKQTLQNEDLKLLLPWPHRLKTHIQINALTDGRYIIEPIENTWFCINSYI